MGCLVPLGAAAFLFAAALRLGSWATFVLAAYVIVWSEVALSVVALSLPHWLTRTALCAAAVLWLGAAGLVWVLLGRPRAPAVAPRLRWLLGMLRDPVLGAPAAVVGLGYVYLAVLGVATPQNDGDSLAYHLPRAVLWAEERSITGTHPGADLRIDSSPVVAEIGQVVTMILAGSERYVMVWQFGGALAVALATFALSRRMGLEAKEALFGAIIVLGLPVVAVQSITAYNDIVVASFVLAAATFILGSTTRELVPLLLAVALAVGTKVSALLLLPLLALVALAAAPRRAWARLAAVGLIGGLLGGGWYVVNVVRDGAWDGGLTEVDNQSTVRSVPVVLFNVERLILDGLELPGARDRAVLLYPIAGLLLACGVVVWGFRSGRRQRAVLVAALLVALVPVSTIAVSHGLARVFAVGWDLRGEDGFADQLRRWQHVPRHADGLTSAFGPFALGAIVTTLVAAVVLVRRRALRPLALVGAAAPIVSVPVVALAISYDQYRWRLVIAAVAFSAALWGLALRQRWLAVTLSAATVVTLTLAVVNYDGKPSGLPLLTRDASGPIWRMHRWEAQTVLYTGPVQEPENHTIRYVEEHVPDDAQIGLFLRFNDWVFPYAGQHLSRTLTFLHPKQASPASATWLIAAPGATPAGCPGSWTLAHSAGTSTVGEWQVWRRTAPDTCNVATPLLRATS